MLEVRQFPGDMSALELDRADPKRCLVAGLFEESVKVGEARRRFYTYRDCAITSPVWFWPRQRAFLCWNSWSVASG